MKSKKKKEIEKRSTNGSFSSQTNSRRCVQSNWKWIHQTNSNSQSHSQWQRERVKESKRGIDCRKKIHSVNVYGSVFSSCLFRRWKRKKERRKKNTDFVVVVVADYQSRIRWIETTLVIQSSCIMDFPFGNGAKANKTQHRIGEEKLRKKNTIQEIHRTIRFYFRVEVVIVIQRGFVYWIFLLKSFLSLLFRCCKWLGVTLSFSFETN